MFYIQRMFSISFVEHPFLFWSEQGAKMLPESPSDSPQSGFFDITHQLDFNHPLLALDCALNWVE